MKKIILILALVLCMAAPAWSLTMTDTTLFTATGTDEAGDLVAYHWGDVNKLEGLGDFVTWDHIFTFDPPASSLLSATLTISLRDDTGIFGGDDLTPEIAFGWTEGWATDHEWTIDDVDTQDYGFSVNVANMADGKFRVTIGSLLGDFYIDKSVLAINYTPVGGPVGVPEPATMLLLGFGLMGLAGLKRKLKK